MKKHVFLFTMDITLDGGVERVVSNMANSFSKRGYRVDIISLFKANENIKYHLDGKIKVKYLFDNLSFDNWHNSLLVKSNLYWRYRLALKFTDKLYCYIDSELSDGETAVVMWNTYQITPLYRHHNVHIIGLDHSRYPFGNIVKGLRHKLHTYMVSKFDIVTTLNEDEVGKWRTIGRPVYVMPNYLPDRGFQTVPKINDRKKVVVSLGRMNTNQKGFDRLIEAYSLIAAKHPDWKLNIYGSGCLQKEYRQLINDLNMQDFIEIFDFTKNPLAVYQTASIYAMCSRDEGFGMVLLEAGSLGIPLVAYNVEFGPRSIIKNSVTGYIVPDGDKVKFAESLEKLMNDEKLREKMSEEILKDIPARFSEEVIMDKWIKIINSI